MGRVRAGSGLLFVHAHPDDETITTGATMALYAARGVPVSLVTCTRGERGEVIPPGLAHLAAEVAGDGGDALAAHRERELATAMAALGVEDHRFLGDGPPGRPPRARWRDSGMALDAGGSVVLPGDAPPDAFALADPDDAARLLADVIGELRPAAVVTYDPGGGYGHPDHVRTHQVTMRAVELAAGAWVVPRTFWVVLPQSLARRRAAVLEQATARGENPYLPVPPGPTPSMVVPDDQVDVVVDAGAFTAAKAAALAAHATQVEVSGGFYALSNRIGQVVSGSEYFHLVRSHSRRSAPVSPADLV